MRRPRPDARSALVIAAVCLPVVLAVARGVASHRTPLGDNGLLALRAHDVLTGNHPFFGLWTSASALDGAEMMNHPSPLQFDLLAPFVRLFGLSAGAIIGTGAINIAALVVAVRQGWHLGGRRVELLIAVAGAGLAWSMGSEMLVDVWQPHALVLPFFALLVCAAAVAAGRWRSLPWAVAVASLCLAHVGYVYLVIGLLGTALGLAWWGDRRMPVGEPHDGAPRRSLVIAAVTGVICWAQPLMEQLFGAGRGNLVRLASARSGGSEPVGLALGVRVTAEVVALPPWFLRPSFSSSIPPMPITDGRLVTAGLVSGATGALALGTVVVALVGLLVALLARGDRRTGALAAIALASVGFVLVTLTQMPPSVIGLSAHQMRWLWPTGALVVVAIVSGADRVVRGRIPAAAAPWRERVAIGVLLVLVVLDVPAHTTDSGPSASRDANATVRSLMDQLAQVELPGPARFDASTLAFAEPYSGPVLAALTAAGQPVRAGDPVMTRQLGPGRAPEGDEAWLLQVRAGGDALVVAEGERLIAHALGSDGGAVAVVLMPVPSAS